MKSTVVSNELDARSEVANLRAPSSPLSPLPEVPLTPQLPAKSYQPYKWQLPNTILDIVDQKTHGRAGQMQRVITYLFFGGFAAVVNLVVFAIMLHLMPSDNTVQNTIAYAVAAELSIMANFIPNDRFTFNTLAGAQRPWLQRCLRFHTTCIVGTILTYLIESFLHFRVNMSSIVAESIAIILVLIYNFSAHHLFTYRHIKQTH